ncbi:hypothetical protein RJ640_020860 [Escallonia rubra]|uniref:Uncharacterized protein n=1 Tax=Escallonia rubra TaxID=112253 RepID=A0AA88QTP8_9ASTE|nr:hypothetical protein RJ640_020860 [Escallonia rubra]
MYIVIIKSVWRLSRLNGPDKIPEGTFLALISLLVTAFIFFMSTLNAIMKALERRKVASASPSASASASPEDCGRLSWELKYRIITHAISFCAATFAMVLWVRVPIWDEIAAFGDGRALVAINFVYVVGFFISTVTGIAEACKGRKVAALAPALALSSSKAHVE